MREKFEHDMYFFLAVLLVPILKRIHHAFMHCKADLVLVILIEASRRCYAHTNFFSESDTLDSRLQDNFDPLRF